jgi:argininosuccinate lyase
MKDDALARVLSPRHFVEVRTTPGGPAPGETARAIATSRLRLAEDDGWLKARIESLRSAELLLKEAVAAL